VTIESRYTDGEWHQLHPMTPFLRGGLTLVAIVGVILVNSREIVIDMVLGQQREDDPILWIAESGYGWIVGLGILALLLVLVASFYVSWRMHTFRITDEVVEVRSGVLFRTHRKGRLDRVQGVSIQRPLLARLVGAARLEVTVAGQDASVKLDYLSSAASDQLRRDILILASGSRAEEARASNELRAEGSLVERRMAELLAPELDPALAAPTSVVELHLGRLLGSIVLSGAMFWLVVFTVVPIVISGSTGELFPLAVVIPGLLGVGGYVVRTFTRSLRYSIASTADGIRIGFGLLSTSNETLPPGRIHAVQITQPLLWRIPGWWRIRINRASSSQTSGAAGQANTTILPVGDVRDVLRVLELMLPELDAATIEVGLVSRGGDDGFVNSPRRARIVRWFSQRRNGFALRNGVALLRVGAIWRSLALVPLARAQSVTVDQGWFARRLRLATVRVHTVAGPVVAVLGAVDSTTAGAFLRDTSVAMIEASGADRTHHWRRLQETQLPLPLPLPEPDAVRPLPAAD
jgi:putative membrane protein